MSDGLKGKIRSWRAVAPAPAADVVAVPAVPGSTSPVVFVRLLEVIPHGGDMHLVTATVDRDTFRDYVRTGDLRGLDQALLRRALAARVRRLHDARTIPTAPKLTGTETYPR